MQQVEHGSQYALTRRGFLDAVWNRIEVVHFYPTSLHRARIFSLPHRLDQYGRVKVALAINPDFPRERQAQSLVHEMIHVDRQAWEQNKEVSTFSPEFGRLVAEEERLTDEAAEAFFKDHERLALLALNHVWLRREELDP